MGNKVTVYKGDVVEVYEDVLGHNIGNGAIQILMMNGNSRIIFEPDNVDIELDEKGEEAFRADYENRLQAIAQSQVDSAKYTRPVEAQVAEVAPKLVPVDTKEH